MRQRTDRCSKMINRNTVCGSSGPDHLPAWIGRGLGFSKRRQLANRSSSQHVSSLGYAESNFRLIRLYRERYPLSCATILTKIVWTYRVDGASTLALWTESISGVVGFRKEELTSSAQIESGDRIIVEHNTKTSFDNWRSL